MCHQAANQSASKVQNRQHQKKKEEEEEGEAHFKTRCLTARVIKCVPEEMYV